MTKFLAYAVLFGGAALLSIGFVAALAGAVIYVGSLAWHAGGGCG